MNRKLNNLFRLPGRHVAIGVATVFSAAILAACAGTETTAKQDSVAKQNSAAKQNVEFVSKVDFKNPKWNRDTFARLDADLNPENEKVGWLRGKVFGVRPNEKVRELFIMEGFSVVRTKRLEDGSWRRMLREIVFYKDIKTGEILDTWLNPYTNETVKVVPIANDPFNFTISEFLPTPPSYGGLNKEKPPKIPFLLDWTEGPDDTIILNNGMNLHYPNALKPEKWVRESSGPFNRVSEQFLYSFSREDAENPNLTHIPHVGSWSRITPWLPWMLMGQAEGHISYFSTFGTLEDGIAGLPADIVAAAKAIDPKFLSAPTEDYGPSLSSLEHYAREQTPAEVPEGWEPPKPPAVPVMPKFMQKH